ERYLEACPADLRNWEWHHARRYPNNQPLTITGHNGLLTDVGFSPDGSLLASGSVGLFNRLGEVRLWDAKTGKDVHTFRGHTAAVPRVAFPPDGKRLASAGQDHIIQIWDVATGKNERTLNGHMGAVTDVAFGPDGERLASSSRDRTVRLWDIKTGDNYFIMTG